MAKAASRPRPVADVPPDIRTLRLTWSDWGAAVDAATATGDRSDMERVMSMWRKLDIGVPFSTPPRKWALCGERLVPWDEWPDG